MATNYDVAIVGGGPGGATAASILKKYNPSLKVAIFERDTFPRDHVGESQLPLISTILDEMGVWDKIEAADFPVKIGATYRWGESDDLWDFHFLPNGEFEDEPRPAKYEGQRKLTAFQVDRALYDKVSLDHARELGTDVFENTAVRSAQVMGDKIHSLILQDGTEIEARYYIDASGHVGFLRRSLGVAVEEPATLKNVAFWDYWTNAEWAVTLGVGGTRIQVMSLGYGWLWFIPIGPDRTSLGLVCPAAYYKSTGMRPEELYLKAVAEDPRISGFVKDATREGKFTTTKDWSFIAEKLVGPNWFLVGESAGFADPILSAGLTLTHSSAREAAYTIMELDRGGDANWLRDQYHARNEQRIRQHIKFGDYWYTANAHFTDLKEFTREIARDAGLELGAEQAFQWLGTGGFADEVAGEGAFASYTISGIHQIAARLSPEPPRTAFGGYNGFVLNLEGAKKKQISQYKDGRVHSVTAFWREGKYLPTTGLYGWVINGLNHSPHIYDAIAFIADGFAKAGANFDRGMQDKVLECLETMCRNGWVIGRKYKNSQPLPEYVVGDNVNFQTNRDDQLPKSRRASTIKAASKSGGED